MTTSLNSVVDGTAPRGGAGYGYTPPWAEGQVQYVTRDKTGHMMSVVPPHYQTRNPRMEAGVGSMPTAMRLHEMGTHSKMSKALATKSPRMTFTRPPEQCPFAQPSVPSPRMSSRPTSARTTYPGYTTTPYALNCFPDFKKISPRLLPQPVVVAAPEAAPERIPTPKLKPASPIKKKKAMDSADPNAVRQGAAALKEKLIDKHGNLQKAFRSIDEDGSGTITRYELARYLEILNLHMSMKPEVVDALFELIDADESGNFDYKEFARVMSAGDVLKMEAVSDYYDGYSAKMKESEDRERKMKEYEAALVGMTAEEYEAYWADAGNGANKMLTSKDMAQVARDRWGKKIRGNVQAHAT